MCEFISCLCLVDVPSPGPVAPLHWVQECVQSLAPDNSPLRSKILVGLNFYGYDFGASSMEGRPACQCSVSRLGPSHLLILVCLLPTAVVGSK